MKETNELFPQTVNFSNCLCNVGVVWLIVFKGMSWQPKSWFKSQKVPTHVPSSKSSAVANMFLGWFMSSITVWNCSLPVAPKNHHLQIHQHKVVLQFSDHHLSVTCQVLFTSKNAHHDILEYVEETPVNYIAKPNVSEPFLMNALFKRLFGWFPMHWKL